MGLEIATPISWEWEWECGDGHGSAVNENSAFFHSR